MRSHEYDSYTSHNMSQCMESLRKQDTSQIQVKQSYSVTLIVGVYVRKMMTWA